MPLGCVALARGKAFLPLRIKKGVSFDIEYQCLRCGKIMRYSEVKRRWEELGVTCIYCGYKVLKKVRPKVVKQLKAV